MIQLMTTYQVQSDQVIIELTESSALSDMDLATTNTILLREAGLKIALDDWGAGNTSFATMRRITFDILKIDGGLIAGIGKSRLDEAVIQHLLKMSEEIGFTIVAEGVETASQLLWLKQAGCKYAQGYHLGMPKLLGDS